MENVFPKVWKVWRIKRIRPAAILKIYLLLMLLPVNMIVYQYVSSKERREETLTFHKEMEAERAVIKNDLEILRNEIDEMKGRLKEKIYEVPPVERSHIREANARLLNERSRIGRVMLDVDGADKKTWRNVKEGVSYAITEIKETVHDIDDRVNTEQ